MASRVIPVLLAVSLCGSAPLAAQVTVGQVDDFEDGTTQGWVVNLLGGLFPPHPFPPVNVPTGGPAGAGDAFMLLTSTGFAGGGGPAPGSRLTVINGTQWAGDYLAAGIVGINLLVNNLSSIDLFLRVMFEDAEAGPPTNVAFSAVGVPVPAGAGWLPVFLPIVPGALTAGGWHSRGSAEQHHVPAALSQPDRNVSWRAGGSSAGRGQHHRGRERTERCSSRAREHDPARDRPGRCGRGGAPAPEAGRGAVASPAAAPQLRRCARS
jgi:hypothetical protein